VNQMDQTTQQNAGMVQQSSAATHGLASEAEALTQLVGQFDIGPREAVGAKKTQPSGRSSRAIPASSATALKTSGRGGAALKPVAQPDDDGWESF